jgi:predicted transcriptional regulator YdeE
MSLQSPFIVYLVERIDETCAEHTVPENSYNKFQHSKTANQEFSNIWYWSQHPKREFV